MTPQRAGLSDRAADLEYSVVREMFERAAAIDEPLVHLEIGEPDFDTPAHVVDAAMAAVRDGATHYTSSTGLPALREAIATRPRGPDAYDPTTELTVTTGGMEALYAALQVTVDPGDSVVLPTPTWPNYLTQTRLAGGRPVEVALPAAEGFALEAERVIEAITPDTAAVVFSSPCNPTGRVFDPDEVAAVVDAAADHGCYVIADEVYDGILYGDQPTGIAGYVDRDDVVLTVNSCSKRYAMTGWRVGWLGGPAQVVDAAAKLRGYVTACPPTPSQHAALAALTGPQDRAAAMAAEFATRRNFLVDRLAEIPSIRATRPDGAIYTFVDVSALGDDSLAVADRLLEEYGVVTAPGTGFGTAGMGWLRLSFATAREQLERGCDRLERMVRTTVGG